MYKRLKGLANLYNSGKGGSWIIILFISLCLGFFYLSIIWGNSNAFYYPSLVSISVWIKKVCIPIN